MALKIKCNYIKTSNLRYPYAVRTQFLRFQFTNKRDAQRFCNQRTRDYKNLYICILDGFSDALLAVNELQYKDIHLRRALNEIQYFIEHPDKGEDMQRFERVCATAVGAYVLIYSSLPNSKRMAKQWEKLLSVHFTHISKPFCEGSVLITRIG